MFRSLSAVAAIRSAKYQKYIGKDLDNGARGEERAAVRQHAGRDESPFPRSSLQTSFSSALLTVYKPYVPSSRTLLACGEEEGRSGESSAGQDGK